MKGNGILTHGGTVPSAGTSRTDAELFVSLRLTTADQVPLFADENVVQAAEIALKSFIRMHRCHILALGNEPNQLYLVIKFIASLSPSELMRMVRETSAEAIARFLSIEHQHPVSPNNVWDRTYLIDTLSPADVPDAIANVYRRVVQTNALQLAWDDFL
jgi:REP element-mobilizing transposase RayT